jgi:hypothetical protein
MSPANLRPRAEDCPRLRSTSLRPLVAPDATRHQLPDGTELELRWRAVKGCFGNGEGRALLVACPICNANARVLYRPEGNPWGCWQCHPLSWRSHRRSGARRGRPKPLSWETARIEAEQRRIADLLGLACWPPERLIWSWHSLLSERRRPGAPALRRTRELALCQRACALETLRIAALLPGINAQLRDWNQELPEWPGVSCEVAKAKQRLAETGWAMRRPAGDSRTVRPKASCSRSSR